MFCDLTFSSRPWKEGPENFTKYMNTNITLHRAGPYKRRQEQQGLSKSLETGFRHPVKLGIISPNRRVQRRQKWQSKSKTEYLARKISFCKRIGINISDYWSCFRVLIGLCCPSWGLKNRMNHFIRWYRCNTANDKEEPDQGVLNHIVEKAPWHTKWKN